MLGALARAVVGAARGCAGWARSMRGGRATGSRGGGTLARCVVAAVRAAAQLHWCCCTADGGSSGAVDVPEGKGQVKVRVEQSRDR
eukprot:14991235-Alexandrium_andersonii.AAC.1